MIDVKKRLEEIAAAIKAGAPAKKFEKEVDRLIGIPPELERDEDAERKWENEYRSNRETD
jgi:hypothetical protein